VISINQSTCCLSKSPFTRQVAWLTGDVNSDVATSAVQAEAGAYLLREDFLSSDMYDKAKTDLQDLHVEKIVHKMSPTQVEGWTLSGERLESNATLIPDSVVNNMRIGDFAIASSQRGNDNSDPNTSRQNRTLVMTGLMLQWSGLPTLTTWTVIGNPKGAYANVKFEALQREEIGLLDKQLGSTAKFDGVTFKVSEAPTALQNPAEQGALRVEQTGKSIVGGRFAFLPRFSQDASGSSYSVGTSPISRNVVHTIITSTQPVKDWKGIAIFRSVPLKGYFANIPLRPKS
jgi:hypothetical protein